MSTIQPLADYVVAYADDAPTKTASGIYIPGGAAEKPKTAVVVAVGPGRFGPDGVVPVSVAVGDRILYSYSTADVKDGGKTYMIIKEDSILAVIKD